MPASQSGLTRTAIQLPEGMRPLPPYNPDAVSDTIGAERPVVSAAVAGLRGLAPLLNSGAASPTLTTASPEFTSHPVLLLALHQYCSPFSPRVTLPAGIADSLRFVPETVELLAILLVNREMSFAVCVKVATPLVTRLLAVLANSRLNFDWKKVDERYSVLTEFASQTLVSFFLSLLSFVHDSVRISPLYELVEIALSHLQTRFPRTIRPQFNISLDGSKATMTPVDSATSITDSTPASVVPIQASRSRSRRRQNGY